MFRKIVYISLICLIIMSAGMTAKAGIPYEDPNQPTIGGSRERAGGTRDQSSGSEFLPNPLQADTFTELFTGIAAWAFSIVGLLAVVMIIVGGFQYIVSAGEEAKIREAKNTIKWAVIGLAVVLGSYAILTAIETILGVK